MKQMMRNIPNILTAARLVGAVVLFFLSPFTMVFYLLYLFCGLTDVLDGFLARRWKCESSFGSKLDSVADLTLYGMMLFRIIPLLWPRLSGLFWGLVFLVLFIRLTSYILAWCKFHQFASMHTYGNKLTGFCVFLLPYTLCFAKINIPCYLICFLAGISSLEELLMHIRNKEYYPNQKSIFLNPTHEESA